mmetsp:Transcript_19044/g.40987  ORF Transcript_19044/g.40987 Transcript_19044/m.40987 type:complete len:306 (+) Transcript_19044:2113-3030(+)
MAGSMVDRLKSFSRASSIISNDDPMCLGMNESISSLAVSSVATFSKSPSDLSRISRSVTTPPPENTTLSTTSSSPSSTSSHPTCEGIEVATRFHPPQLVLVHPETKPYAQLCFDKKLDTMTTLLVRPRGLPAPLTGSYASSSIDEQEFEEPTVPAMVLSSSSSSSSSCSSGTGDSGWSTGSDDMSSSKLSNGGSVDLLVWVDEDWWNDIDSTRNGASPHGLEQRQSLLRPESVPLEFHHHHGYDGPSSRAGESGGCLCYPCPFSRKRQDPHRHYALREAGQANRVETSWLADLPSNWFRYRSLTD